MPLHSIAKSAVKPIFSPLPHPFFFAPKSPFFPLFPVSNPISGHFSRDRVRFLPCEAHFFSSFLVLGPTADDFSRARHSFQPRTSIFPRSVLYSPTLRALLREISPFIFPALPFLHCVKVFPIRLFPLFILCSTFLFPLISFPPLIHPTLHLLPPLSFSFLPTFPSSSPIHARSRAPSRNTRVRVHPYAPIRQEVFVYCLHLFTHLPQSAVHQHIRCEGKQEKAFTKHTTISKSTSYHKRPISSTVNSICRRDEPHASPP